MWNGAGHGAEVPIRKMRKAVSNLCTTGKNSQIRCCDGRPTKHLTYLFWRRRGLSSCASPVTSEHRMVQIMEGVLKPAINKVMRVCGFIQRDSRCCHHAIMVARRKRVVPTYRELLRKLRVIFLDISN